MLMDADGSSKQRLTFFNEPGHSHQRAERTIVSDSNCSSQLVLVTLAEE